MCMEAREQRPQPGCGVYEPTGWRRGWASGLGQGAEEQGICQANVFSFYTLSVSQGMIFGQASLNHPAWFFNT